MEIKNFGFHGIDIKLGYIRRVLIRVLIRFQIKIGILVVPTLLVLSLGFIDIQFDWSD